jgi:hypothetical protein
VLWHSEENSTEGEEMTAMRVIYTGPEHRPHVEPVFEEKEVVADSPRGGTEASDHGVAPTQ